MVKEPFYKSVNKLGGFKVKNEASYPDYYFSISGH